MACDGTTHRAAHQCSADSGHLMECYIVCSATRQESEHDNKDQQKRQAEDRQKRAMGAASKSKTNEATTPERGAGQNEEQSTAQ